MTCVGTAAPSLRPGTWPRLARDELVMGLPHKPQHLLTKEHLPLRKAASEELGHRQHRVAPEVLPENLVDGLDEAQVALVAEFEALRGEMAAKFGGEFHK